MITMSTYDLPLPAPTTSVWYLVKRVGAYGGLVDVREIDVEALRKRLKARRTIRGGQEGA